MKTVAMAAATDERERASAPRGIRVPSVAWCGVLVLSVRIALKVRGFEWTMAWVRRRTTGIPIGAPVRAEALRPVDHAVAMASALYPGRALCLEQSLVLYYVLRRQGVPVKYCQGVRPHPFEAHAWVEYGDLVLNDVREHTKVFARLPEQLP